MTAGKDDALHEELRRKVAGFDLLQAPGHLLRRNHQRSLDVFVRHVGKDVTRQQIALLLAVSQRPGASQRDFVEATGFDKSTLKEMLERMIRSGWVQRDRDERDRRAWRMSVTSAGEALLVAHIQQVEAAQQEILAPLPEADRTVFMRCLRTLIGLE